jgi:hypothetical protein
MSFPNVTIGPLRGRKTPQDIYRISVDTPNPTPTVDTGEYGTVGAVLEAFTWPLKPMYQAAIVEALEKNESITFSLEDAHDLGAM